MTLKDQRNLTGIYFRFKNPNNGTFENRTFEDLPESEQDKILQENSEEWKDKMIKILCDKINHIGNELDLYAE
jgi:hypothetical protein